MRSRLTTLAIGTAALVAAGLVAPGTAGAITGGTEDLANRYSNVGLILFYDDGVRYRCTATLVQPDVLLTAGHCTFGTSGGTIVTFDPDVARTPTEAAAEIPTAADPALGFQPGDLGADDGEWRIGTASTHPAYSDFTDLDNWNDVGVVQLAEPVAGITPASIADRGALDEVAQPALNKTAVTVVGYGTEVRKPVAGPQKPTPMSYPIVRRYTDAIGQKLTPQILQTNGNENDNRAGGGSCFGDSGGPSFLDGDIVTVTSYGRTDNCRYIDGLQRVDIGVVQDWLATFGVTPAA
ncbi:trypsin-like serine protease [Modestobacter sp. I12A-02628]|uniref:S1 family peptidase n=1 Tax=Goekera deserti TaxID=2497753 RepID=A0A7K3WFI2_9ACTN|nr:trypsin-like serine protease [Goekera deserti]MPR00053.1 trypsin-like serine protease [Goekera deserti]NDI49832.1 trypsin-like serine protease [Goekera deserti]NEL55194.1 S1 family peptidase [Goekera deserti]